MGGRIAGRPARLGDRAVLRPQRGGDPLLALDDLVDGRPERPDGLHRAARADDRADRVLERRGAGDFERAPQGGPLGRGFASRAAGGEGHRRAPSTTGGCSSYRLR